MLNRRDLLRTGLALAIGATGPRRAAAQSAPSVMTVRGRRSNDTLGPMLAHEHLMVDFIGADKVSRDRYDPDEVFKAALPHLKRVRELGCRTFVDATPAYLGRDVALLKRLSEASDLHILTNTGYYGANGGKHLPAHVHAESADELAARWLKEHEQGIDGTDVKAGFIKIGVDAGPLNAVNRKLVQAAARVHLKSGLTIASHTGDGRAAMEQLDVLGEERVKAEAFIWVHAQNEKDGDLHARAAGRGAWVEFDGVAPETIDVHLGLVKAMKEKGRLGRVLLSHDAGWYHVGEPGGGRFRPFDTLFTEFLPVLRQEGFTPREIAGLTVEQPARAFADLVRQA